MKRMYHAAWGLALALLVALILLPLTPVYADFGTNWQAEFFNNTDLSGSPTQTITGVNGVNFEGVWGVGAPSINGITPAGIGADNFSIRFTSSQNLTPGVYNFVVGSDDGMRVFINGALVYDRFVDRTFTRESFTANITSSPVNFRVDYYERVDQASVTFQWFLQGSTTPVATSGIPPTPAPTSVPLTASVVSVRGLSLRSGPYLGASLIGVLRPGTAYSPLARNTDEGGSFTWFLINTGTQTGWASGRYLEFTGDVNLIPLQSTVFEQIDGAPDLGVLAVPRSIMNFRRRPSQRSAVIGQIEWGAETSLIGRTIQGGNNFWFQVRYNGQVGWIYAPFVSVRGNINAVPIR
jgi:uncharacterized protein YraI